MQMLGYTQSWLDPGVVDDAYLRKQCEKFQTSDDQNPEHYRWAAFLRFLDRRGSVSQEEIDGILSLTDEGPDGVDLRSHRIIESLASGILTDRQLDTFGPLLSEETGAVGRRYRRCVVQRALKRDGLTDALFCQIVASDDQELHLAVLDSRDARREHLEWLAINGRNKPIRNRASQMLKRKR